MDFCGVRFLLCCFQGRGGRVVPSASRPGQGRAVGEAIQLPLPDLAHQKDTLQKPG